MQQNIFILFAAECGECVVYSGVNSTHRVNVVRIPEIQKHPNADTLGLVKIGGYQVVVKLGEFHEGELAVYVQPDSVVPQSPEYEFLWAEHEFPDGIVPQKYRRVTVRRFRKEWSEGLLLKLLTENGDSSVIGVPSEATFYYAFDQDKNARRVQDGDDVAAFLGITHYVPPEPLEQGENEAGPGKRNKRWPRSLKGWLYLVLEFFGFHPNGAVGGFNERGPVFSRPVYDVEAFKNNANAFEPDEQVVITEKIHGSNARFTFEDGKLYVGSHRCWKSNKRTNIWHKAVAQYPEIEQWCREHEGWTLYGEVVPTQGEKFKYGCEAGQVKLFLFDVLDPHGEWIEYPDLMSPDGDYSKLPWVPVLYVGPFRADEIKAKLVDGFSTVEGAKHIREGVVIRAMHDRHVYGLGRLQLKLTSNSFLEQS